MIQQTPVLIYQMGKVGSTTMMAALEAARIPNIHVHFLSRQHLDEIEKHYQNLPHAQIPQHICRSKQIMSAIEDTRGKIRWKVITLVREPIARMISDVFQNITDRMPQINHAGEDEACRIISDDILNSLENFEEKTDYLCTWYDKEIKVVFEFDVYSWPFNKSEGYQIYEARNADILLIKIEKLSGCYRQALDDFIGLTDIALSDANAAISKLYRRLYKRVKENFAIPESCLERIYSTRFVKQFYTAEEIDRFKKKWRLLPHTQREPKLNDAGPPASLFAVSSLENHTQRQTRQTNGAESVASNRASSFSNADQAEDLPVLSVITPSFNQAQYLELWTRFFRYSRLYVVDALIAGYRFQPSSKTRLFMDKYLKEADRILDKEIQLFRAGAYKDLLLPREQIDMAEVREALAQVEKVNPGIAMNFYAGDGNLTLKSGHQLALEFYERSKKMDPNNCIIRNSLGMLYWQDGEVKKAIGEFVNALRINPDFPDALINWEMF